jgi:hypothetical protein
MRLIKITYFLRTALLLRGMYVCITHIHTWRAKFRIRVMGLLCAITKGTRSTRSVTGSEINDPVVDACPPCHSTRPFHHIRSK